MHEIALLFGQVAAIIVITVAALAGVAVGTRALWRLTTGVTPRDGRAVSRDDFHRLETAVDAIAIEVERISESQRYSAALLNERIPGVLVDKREASGASVTLPPEKPPG